MDKTVLLLLGCMKIIILSLFQKLEYTIFFNGQKFRIRLNF
ncbi:hypothetical protein LEP1GSC083_2696 [Leptospira interrogans serovar Pyrogenes str. L0374]|uniref:Uncharacterized protein n=1 Tax=Leptospira interrogans serovar Pyrogenes str. L0374 TaxID=1049928 RepID=M6K397_LEPIR|nr:hypothetical protein LEP1GSC080_0107 [Leptospira interrogans str. FPW2026]EKO04871.1 hypothetical protein LEP1GSC077_3734 [Leptospira interrogans str. C10069]EMM90673.1 hypothetical protein LEP1GSC145_3275 [Leptospira interrogans serovar Djasiman str. LT1649]EMN28571.1 hypothetical protein LEP1GSC083_2696 [Leptospira interrogans serovar Pyrogenes str. L0374]EMN61247.1 hypothetical protein LEP1GSC092_3442 [Leptospira interrogans serovar Pyrogenes str. R168]